MISSETKFSVILYGLLQALRFMSRRHPAFARRLAERNLTAQMKTADSQVARYFSFDHGKIASGRGLHPKADITITVQNAEVGARLFTLKVDHLERIEAIKNFQMLADGPDELMVWFTQTLGESMGAYGERVSDPAQLKPALQRALATGGCAVIHVDVDPVKHMWAPGLIHFKKMHEEPKA